MSINSNPSWILVDIRDGLRGQPGRLLLAVLAIAVGLLALTLLISTIMGLQQKSQLVVQELGANVVAVMPAGPSTDGQTGLQARHLDILRSSLPHHLISGVKQYRIIDPVLKTRINIIAADDRLCRVRPFELQQGRYLDPVDLREQQPVCLVSRELADAHGIGLGQVFQLPPLYLKVAGILAAQGGVLQHAAEGNRLSYGDYYVLLPRSLTPLWHTGPQAPAPALDTLYIQCPPDHPPAQTVSTVQQLLKADTRQTGNLSYITPATLIRGIVKLQRTLQLTTGSISVLCLVLGGTTLMSLMIANVRERISEIGLRLSLGASEADIYSLFIMEGVITTFMATLLGTGGAHLLLLLLQHQISFPLYLGWATVLVPMLTAIILAVLFSYGPARYAARITPSEALRNE